MNQARNHDLLYGRNPVLEILRAKRRTFYELTLQVGATPNPVLDEIRTRAEDLGISIHNKPRPELDAVVQNHQGVVLRASSYPYVDLEDVLEAAQKQAEPPLILVLDQLQDPQNFGTLLRTAEAVGVHGVLLPAKHAVGVTPAVVSASSGASEHLRICRANIAQAIRALKQQDIWFVGLERGEESQRIDRVDLTGPLGLIVGNEGTGLRPLVRESCDFLASIPMRGDLESLNAAVAGSLVLYRIWEQRGFGYPSS